MPKTTAREQAEHFLSEEKAFRLGQLLTESSHPKTRTLSQTLRCDIEAGIRMLQSVDDDIREAMGKLFAQDSIGQLVEALVRALERKKRIFFTGCGATGRLMRPQRPACAGSAAGVHLGAAGTSKRGLKHRSPTA